MISVLLTLAMVYAGNSIDKSVLLSPTTGLGIVVGLIGAAASLWIVLRGKSDRVFLRRIFVAALLLRWIVGSVIYFKNWQPFFGADADTYDAFGNALCKSWLGVVDPNAPWLVNYTSSQRPGFGMFYYVASVYYLIGQNPLAIQLIDCALGASLCVVAYKIAMVIYPGQRVARTAAALTAFCPSLILWSSQGLKDGPITLFIALCTLFTLRLRDRFNGKEFLLLLGSIFCLFVLRNYAAYMVFIAMAGTLVLAARKFTPLRIGQSVILVIVIGLALSYFAGGHVQEYAESALNLKRMQAIRVWGAKASGSGYGADVDISDPRAALGFLPVGIAYVLFAPFPWMMGNLRQLITLPEMIVWWLLVPILLRGYWFSLRHRLRESFPITIFSIGLTLAYALYQSNVGTAYRQRAQLFVFFFVFISIGLELRRVAKQRRRRALVGQPVFARYAAQAIPQLPSINMSKDFYPGQVHFVRDSRDRQSR
jgi:4-amino-4-deoxy-L-arabinose transferase-like glycosyltransferase